MGKNNSKEDETFKNWKKFSHQHIEQQHHDSYMFNQLENNLHALWIQYSRQVLDRFQKDGLLETYSISLKEAIDNFRESERLLQSTASFSQKKTTILRSFSLSTVKKKPTKKETYLKTLHQINQNSDLEKHDYLAKYFMIIEEEISHPESLMNSLIHAWQEIFLDKFEPFIHGEPETLTSKSEFQFLTKSLFKDIDSFADFLDQILKQLYMELMLKRITKNQKHLNQKFRALTLRMIYGNATLMKLLMKIVENNSGDQSHSYQERLSLLADIRPEQLGIPVEFSNHKKPFSKLIEKLREFQSQTNPCYIFPAIGGMRQLLLDEVDALSKASNVEITSDDSLNIWVFITIKANDKDWYLKSKFIDLFLTRDNFYNYPKDGQNEYVLSTAMASCNFLAQSEQSLFYKMLQQ